MVQRTEPSSNIRKVFIQRKGEEEPVLLYAHERSAEVAVGHQGRVVVINDFFATKACKVIVADINSGKNWRIDEKASQQYLQTAPKEWFPRDAVPEAAGFSLDDKMVLIAMKSGYVATSPKEASQFGKSFRLWSYVVDSANGALLKTYQTNGIVPRKWWELEGGT